MGSGMTKKLPMGAAIAGWVIWLCGCAGSREPQPPNFIVQDVQTGTRPAVSAAPTGPPEACGGNVRGEDTENGMLGAEGSALDKAETENETVSDSIRTEEINIFGERPEAMGGGGEKESAGASMSEEGSDEVEIRTAHEAERLKAGTAVDPENIAEEELAGFFSFKEIPDAVFERMKGKSYSESCTVPCEELRYVRVLHYGFDGLVHIGELVVNRAIAQDIADIFLELFQAEYPIEKILLIDEYNADDNASMADNNTSSFNYRFVEGTKTISLHAYGLAVDINPLYNPYLPMRDGVAGVLPENGTEYADRSLDCAYYIRPGDVCCRAFAARGFTWGGDWESSKDYQHFSKKTEQ